MSTPIRLQVLTGTLTALHALPAMPQQARRPLTERSRFAEVRLAKRAPPLSAIRLWGGRGGCGRDGAAAHHWNN